MHLRSEYQVGPDLKFLSNLDMMHLMERALRRAAIPYVLSEGYNPHIRLSMGTVLPVGLWGEKEYFDLELHPMPPELFMQKMNLVLPEAIRITTCQEIRSGAASLMKMVNAAAYAFRIDMEREKLAELRASILDQVEIRVQSRGKNKRQVKDLRSGIYYIDIIPENGTNLLEMMVSVNEPVNVRFDELAEVLSRWGVTAEQILDFWRRGNYIKQGERFFTPLEIQP